MASQTTEGAFWTQGSAQVPFPGPDPGPARATVAGQALLLENRVLRCEWIVAGDALRPGRFRDLLSGAVLDGWGPECFRLELEGAPRGGHRDLPASAFRVVSVVREHLGGDPGAARAAARCAGWRVTVTLAAEAEGVHCLWCATLRDGANYIRMTLRPAEGAFPPPVRGAVLVEGVTPGAAVAGAVQGSPLVAGPWFLGCEHPLAENLATGAGPAARVRCGLRFGLGQGGRSDTASAILGVAPAGQTRRAFLYYLERERAQPYRQYLHYNNGYEIGCEYWRRRAAGAEAEALAFQAEQGRRWVGLIRAFNAELAAARGVPLDGFVHDFTWDDDTRPWEFHRGFPDGFAPARAEAARYGAGIGVWFSPVGGYPCRPSRVKAGQALGFLTTPSGLTLACPHYRRRFREACLAMVRDEGAGYFKFDGFGAGNNQAGAGPYAADVEGLLEVIEAMRRERPEVLINASTGSWPSPFWLRWVDMIWRQGADSHVQGKGSPRQQWITYRDAATHAGVVRRAPLYPLNALMLHGVFINRAPFAGNPYGPSPAEPPLDPGDIRDEVRTFFASGTALQELYVNPELMTSAGWDCIAEAARWARANAAVLADTHWVGGDPAGGAAYGWAAWSPHKAILTLRNPDDRRQEAVWPLADLLELPREAAAAFRVAGPGAAPLHDQPAALPAEGALRTALGPFEVRVFELRPV